MEMVYSSKDITINFHPHMLGSSYQIILEGNRTFLFEENSLECLANQSHERLSEKLQFMDNIFYSTLTFSEVESISKALKKVKEDYDKKVENFIEQSL